MGCDIHLVVERRDGDRWVAVHTTNATHGIDRDGELAWSCPAAVRRNYRRFAALAGVRGDGPEPRGIPHDASDYARMEIRRWGRDGHSHSWLPLAEALPIFVETERWPDAGHGVEYARRYPAYFFFDVNEVDPDLGDHRIVFWFDN